MSSHSESRRKQQASEISCLCFSFCSPDQKKRSSSREENVSLLLPLVLICAFPFGRSPVSAKVPQKHARFGVCHTSWVQSPDHTALISLIPLHIEVTVVCNGKDMRWQLSNPLVAVQPDKIDCVERQQLVWIHCYQDRSRVSLENSYEHYLQQQTHNQQ